MPYYLGKAKVTAHHPVSLTSIVSSVMEHCIVRSMFRHLVEDNNTLYPSQHVFRSRLSTDTQLVTFVDKLTSEVSCARQVGAIILNFSKAFDKVCHQRLLHKLSFTVLWNNWQIRWTTDNEFVGGQ